MNEMNNPPLLGQRLPSCAACAYARKRCKPDCLFRPYLLNNDAEHRANYVNIHKLFGHSNALNTLKDSEPHLRDDAMKSIIFEANAWNTYPGRGCVHILHNLYEMLRVKGTELEQLRQELMNHSRSNNSSISSGSSLRLDEQSTSCAACECNSRECQPECPLRRYFPNNDNSRAAYIKVHKLFDYDYVLKVASDLELYQRDQAIKSIIYEAEIWDRYPGQGCLHIVNELQEKIHVHMDELNELNQQLANANNRGQNRAWTPRLL